MIGELGADVIKVEPPGGSPARASLFQFAAYNANKRSICLPQTALDHPQWPLAESMASNSVVGSPESVRTQLAQLAADTGAAELMVNTATFGLADRLRNLELTAVVWAGQGGSGETGLAGNTSGDALP